MNVDMISIGISFERMLHNIEKILFLNIHFFCLFFMNYYDITMLYIN